MISLLFLVLCSAGHALVLKKSEVARRHRLAVTTANYIVGSAGALILLAVSPLVDILNGPSAPSLTAAIVIGLITGTIYVGGLLWFQECISRHGVGLAGTFGKLGLLVPILLSVLFWGEAPSWVQWGGVAAGIVAIFMLTLPEGGLSWRKATRPALLLLLLTMGTAEFMAKVFQRYAEQPTKPLYVAITFTTALILSGALLLRGGRKITFDDLKIGVLVGLPNLGSLVFLIAALQTFPASIVFATFAIGSLVLIVVGGAVIFGERLTRREQIAICVSIVALLLLHA